MDGPPDEEMEPARPAAPAWSVSLPRPRRRRSFGSARPGLQLLVGGDVPAHLGLGAAAALVGLLLVRQLDLGEVEGDVLRQPVLAAGAARADRSDHDLGHL